MTSPFPIDLPSAELAVSTHELSKSFGRQRALENVALQVPHGAVYLLVGPNGAGKSTTLRILVDLLRPTSGVVTVLGLDPQKQPAVVRANSGYVPDQPTWGHGWMRAGRLLEHHASFFPSWDAEYAARLCRTFDVRLESKVGTLSKGQARRIHVVMALAHRPRLLLLDEPLDGLDPVMRDEILGALVEHLSDAPTTVLLSTHHVAEVGQIADHIGVLRDGALHAQMPLSELRRDLRRYRAEVPAGWQGDALLGDAVLRRTGSRNEVDWTIWGEQSQIADELATAGATVRESAPLTLEEATLALLNPNRNAR
ncbi:MAG: ABC transporter ATP-binding protein [bacterium]